MDSDAVDGKRMALALGALQERVQRLQKARKDAVAERTALEVRADHLDAALDAAAQQGLGLPTRFLDLVARSEALFEQICRLDDALYGQSRKPMAANPVIDQISQLQRAAETGAFDPLMVWHRAK